MSPEIIKRTEVYSILSDLFCPILNGFSQQIFTELRSIKFHENPPSNPWGGGGQYHQTESLWNHTTTCTDHTEGEQMEDRRNVGESSCNSGDGTDYRVQSLMFIIIIIIIIIMIIIIIIIIIHNLMLLHFNDDFLFSFSFIDWNKEVF
jgi:hypothetical protein